MKTFKELPSRVETRVTILNRVNRFVRSNREDVGHRYAFLFCGPGVSVSGDDLCLCVSSLPFKQQLALVLLHPEAELPRRVGERPQN